MRARWQGNCLWAVVLVVLSGVCHAQSTSATPEDEYKQLIKVNQDIQPLGAHPFGENISLYDGSLSFEETDVSLPGNGPTIRLSRSLAPEVWAGDGVIAPYPFGDWDLDIPRIETITASPMGWKTSTPGTMAGDANRCTNFTPPPYAPSTAGGGGSWAPEQFWYGYHLLIPGQGSQELMPRAATNTLTPTMSGMSFSIVTKNNWMIGCGVTASDGGEGFLAIAPDGTRYTFAHLVYRPAAKLTEPLGSLPPPPSTDASTDVSVQQGVHPMMSTGNLLERNDALMYVTQIQDRFGNTVTYHYDPSTGYLSSITASDGRNVTLSYVPGTPLVQTVTVQASNATPRTWTYSYAGDRLAGVQLPDGSAWSYNLSGLSGAFSGAPIISPNEGGFCQSKTLPTLPTGTATGSITQPSGLTATFTLTPMLHGRSYTPWECYGGSPALVSLYPEYYAQYSMTSEVVSGAGVPTETWSYSYSPANLSWNNDACATSGTCPTSVYTDVTDPGGNDTRTTFSNRFDASEGQLLRTDYYSGAAGGTLMRSVANTYASPTGGPWPTAYGTDLQGRDNTAQTTEASPLQQRTTTQGGQNYTWQAMAFDAYAQPTDVKRYNDITGQIGIEETTSYLNDTNLWVLGLPQTVTNVGTGEVESSNTYTSLDELHTRSRFGELLMTYGWHSAGQLASFTDGDNHTTTLGNYYRGIPQTIDYPDGTSESLVVNDLGDIASITDQAGHTTGYQYDALGRLAEIDYPTGDETAWYPKKFAYTFVTSAERGVGAGHWRRTVTVGDYSDTTYFDAKLRPVLDDTSTGAADSDITSATGYDWDGRTVFTSYPVSGTPDVSDLTLGMHSSYDALGRLTQSQQDSERGLLTTTTRYLPGPGTQVTDPMGNITTTYDQAFDQPVYNVPWSISAPEGVTQTIARDIYGEPTQITQSGTYDGQSVSLSKTLVYDIYHRFCRLTDPESGSEVVGYDGANNIRFRGTGLAITGTGCGKEQVPTAAMTTYTYDPMNRVQTITPPAGTQGTEYWYTPLGQPYQEVSGISTWNATYNFRGMLTSEVLSLPGVNPLSVAYSHDAYGHLAAMSQGFGTRVLDTVAYAPDPRGLASQVGSYATGIGYFPNGQVASFTYGDGHSYVAQQNTRQLTSNFSDGEGGTLDVSEDLAYDADGNLDTVNDLVDGLRTKSFGYDALNRLTSATAANLYGTESYTYDPLNNLRTRLTGGQTLDYNYNGSNQLASITSGTSTLLSLGYDANGNENLRNGVSLQFDAKNQLLQIPNVASYSYDGEGRRVEKQPAGGGSPSYYFYSHAGQLLTRYTPATSTITDYIHLGRQLIAQHDSLELADPGAITFNVNPSLDGTVTVSWGAVSLATGYILEESANGGSTWTSVYAGAGTQAALTGLAGGSYTFQVQACASGTCSNWTPSATLGVVPAASAGMTVPTALTFAPFTVAWAASPGATGYTLQQSFNGGAWTTLGSAITATSFSVTSAPGGTYTYRVAASNAYGTSGWTSSAAVAVTQVPATPTNVTITTDSSGNTVLGWDAMAWATSYQVTVEGVDGNLGTYLYTVGQPGFTVPAGKYQAEQVTACSIAGCSPAAVLNAPWGGTPGAAAQRTVPAWQRKSAAAKPTVTTGCTATHCVAGMEGTP